MELSLDHPGIEEILATTNRLPFDLKEIRFAKEWTLSSKAKGRDLEFDNPFLDTDDLEPNERLRHQFESGVLCISSRTLLQKRFLFVKENAGKGLFWGQRVSYRIFMGHVEIDDWIPVGSKRMWGLAVTSIGNVFREAGHS